MRARKKKKPSHDWGNPGKREGEAIKGRRGFISRKLLKNTSGRKKKVSLGPERSALKHLCGTLEKLKRRVFKQK